MSTKCSVAFGGGYHLWRDAFDDAETDGLWLGTMNDEGDDVVADLPVAVLDAIVEVWPALKAGRRFECVNLSSKPKAPR